MKILFLHLSDIHCNDKKIINDEKTSALISTLNLYNNAIDKVIIICSGDLTNTGNKNEFKLIRTFFGKILSEIGKKYNMYINLFVVPGNHDLYYKDGLLPKTSEINNYLKSERVDDYFEAYKEKLTNFYFYAKSKNCFINNKWIDNVYLDITNEYGKTIKLQLNLINTAPFSTSKEDNKESHYLPESELDKLCKEKDVDYVATVMHHGPEWFCYKTKTKLEEKLYQGSEFVFQGHEHTIGAIKETNEHEDDLIVLKGGEYSGQFEKDSSYSLLLLDTEKDTFSETIFRWNKNEHIYEHNDSVERKINKKIPVEKLYPKKQFVDYLLKDNEGISDSILEYYTFPQIEGLNNNESLKINDSKAFFNLLLNHRIINLRGKRRAGKSVTLKKLYNDSINAGYCPLYLYNDNLQTKISTLIKNLFNEQYSKKESHYNKFEYLDKDKRIIFVDDFDAFTPKMQKLLLQHLVKYFGYIVFCSKEKVALDLAEMVQESLISEIDDEFEIFPVLICDFYKEKRLELIKNVLKAKDEYIKSNIDTLVSTIDYLVNKKYGLFELNPEFIIQYIKYFISKQNEEDTDAVFNVIFETNIRNLIIKNSSKANIENHITLLEEIAYNIHFKYFSEKITLDNIKDIANECKVQRGLEINIRDFIDSMKSSLIFKESYEGFSYEFTNINYLAYFVAKKINKLIEKSGFDINEIYIILKYICFGINDNIILFLLYLRNNTIFTINLCNEVNQMLTNIDELNFDNNNIPFLKKISSDEVNAPSNHDKTRANKRLDEIEKVSRANQDKEIYMNKIYDYPDDIDDMKYKIPRSMKYIEIIAKSFVSQFNDYMVDEKKIILNTVYSCPNKILYFVLKPYNDNYKEIFNELKRFVEIMGISDRFTDSVLEDVINKSANDICLNVYNNYAFISSNKKTLAFINQFPLSNTNYKIYNLIFEENGGTSESFVKKAIDMFDENDDMYIHYLIRRIAFKHIISKENISHKLIDRINDKLFNKSSKTKLLRLMNDKKIKKD